MNRREPAAPENSARVNPAPKQVLDCPAGDETQDPASWPSSTAGTAATPSSTAKSISSTGRPWLSWAFCNGQLLAVSQNDALFSLLGTIYGGDGRTTFGLPDMRGRIPLHQGTGPGLSPRRLGSKGGGEQVTLTSNQLASHTHDWNANAADATGDEPQGKVLATAVNLRFWEPAAPNVDLASSTIANTGGSQPHTNLMPTLCIHFIVALFGIYPSRN